jgi:hypothetical protein
MGLISRAWTNLAPPGAISPPVDLTHSRVNDEPFFIRDVSEDVDPVTAYRRRGASCARIKQLVTRRSQYSMHLF